MTLHQGPRDAYRAHVARSGVRFSEMEGLLWTGDPLPKGGISRWKLATRLRKAMDADICEVRGSKASRIGYIVPGTTPVWKDVLERLKCKPAKGVAVVHLDRGKRTVTLLEDGGKTLGTASKCLKKVPSEEMHLATCRACDFGIARTAGGVLGCSETQRPAVLVDEPGHWLGRIQRDQCREAGLCVLVSFGDFLSDPAGAVQRQADKLGKGSELDKTVDAARKLGVGAETDLARYLFRTYIE